MLRLYGSAKSRGLRTLWMLGELGVPYEHKDYLPRSPETKTPEFVAMNPNSRVPVIDDDGFILTESSAIMKYLADKFDLPAYPKGLKERARVNEMMDWFNTGLYRDFGYGFIYCQVFPNQKREGEAAQAGAGGQ